MIRYFLLNFLKLILFKFIDTDTYIPKKELFYFYFKEHSF